jgi:hypothetical protein
MEKSDIVKLKKEVLDHGTEAALPVNLPDIWVKLLARDLEMLRDGAGEDNEDHSYLTAPLAIIVHILFGRKDENEHEISFSDKDLFIYLDYLQFEISLEEIRRWTDISPEPATLETIFTDRKVKISSS